MITFCPLSVRYALVYFRFVRSDYLLLMVVMLCAIGWAGDAGCCQHHSLQQYRTVSPTCTVL